MFAYCNNNCVFCSDYSGHYATFDSNLLIDEEAVYHEIVNGQGREPYASMDFGSSTVEKSGCGAIAVHNALVLLGISSDLRRWTSFFASKWPLRRFGVMPWEIDDALDSVGICYEGSLDSSITERCKNGGVVILTYFCKTRVISEPATYYSGPTYGTFRDISAGMHTVAITYHDSAYWVYNSWNKATKAEHFSDLSYYTGEEKFIYGYYVFQTP